jgi:hypothetical protein
VLCKHEVAGSSPVTSTNLYVCLESVICDFVDCCPASSAKLGTVSREEVEPGVLVIYRCQGAKPR